MYTQTAFPVIDLAGTGRSIERHRRDAGLTVRDLQAYFGFEYPQAIYKWQHGECLPTVDNLLALARLLRVSMEDLLVYDDQGVSHFWEIVLLGNKKPKQDSSRFGSLPRIPSMTMRCSQPLVCSCFKQSVRSGCSHGLAQSARARGRSNAGCARHSPKSPCCMDRAT